MRLIKNARVYRITLPEASGLSKHLEEIKHREIKPVEAFNRGFVPVLDEGELVHSSDDVTAFAVRMDRKLLPGSVVRDATTKRVKEIEENEGRRVGRKERREIEDVINTEMIQTSHVVSKVVTVFYHRPSRFLFVPTSSQDEANIIISLLINAVGAAKTETIHISTLKGGLTARLSRLIGAECLQADGPFGEFDLEPQVWLKRDKEKATYQINEIGTADAGLAELLSAGFEVDAVRLGYSPVSFKLTGDFVFKSIKFEDPAEDEQEAEDATERWGNDANLQVFSLVKAVEALCILFDYKAPESENAESAS